MSISEPYLIAHLVRGQPAFDIAEKTMFGEEEGWIIPTSGHRARPFWDHPVKELYLFDNGSYYNMMNWGVVPGFGPMDPPDGWPDHYAVNNSSPSTVVKGDELNLEELGLL